MRVTENRITLKRERKKDVSDKGECDRKIRKKVCAST